MHRAFRTVNPFNNSVIKEFESLSERQLVEKIVLARQGYGYNKRRAFSERDRMLDRMIDIMNRNGEEYAEVVTLETGKPISESMQEVKESIDYVRMVKGEMTRVLQEQRIKTMCK